MASDDLSIDDVRRLARLSALEISDADADDCRQRLAAILRYVDRLNRADVAAAEPLPNPTADTDADHLADDQPGPTLPQRDVLALAPDTLGPFLRVPKVFGEGSA